MSTLGGITFPEGWLYTEKWLPPQIRLHLNLCNLRICYFYWQIEFCRRDEMKRLDIILDYLGGFSVITKIHYKEMQKESVKERVMWWQKQRLDWCALKMESHQPSHTGNMSELEKTRSRFSLTASEGNQPGWHQFWILTSTILREYIFVVLRHYICGNLLQQQ